MRLLPVLDVQAGQVVHGQGGRRAEYRPIVSRLTSSCRPVEVAEAFRTHFALQELYLADLDALMGAEPDWSLYASLRDRGFRLWVDAGVRDLDRGTALAATGIESVVVGLETVAGSETLAALAGELQERLVFSLDLKGGRPLAKARAWQEAEPWDIATQAIALGVRRLLVLDLAQVGSGAGTGTEDLCRRLTAAYPEIELAAGGGVAGPADLQRLERCGVSVVLAASALHDGRLQP